MSSISARVFTYQVLYIATDCERQLIVKRFRRGWSGLLFIGSARSFACGVLLCIRSDWVRSIRAGSSGGSSRPNSASREFAEFVYRVAVAKGLLDSTQAVTSSASLGSQRAQ